MKLFTKRLSVELTSGKFHEVRALSITQTEEFRSTFNLLGEELQDEAYKKLNFLEAYNTRPLAKKYFDDLLGIAGLKVEQLGVDVIESLLFPHENSDGSYSRQGDLVKFICGELKDGPTEVPKEVVDSYANILAQLWTYHQDFEKALAVLNNINYEDLADLLKIKAEMDKPTEQRIKEVAQKKVKEAIKESLKGQKFEVGEEVDINSLIEI